MGLGPLAVEVESQLSPVRFRLVSGSNLPRYVEGLRVTGFVPQTPAPALRGTARKNQARPVGELKQDARPPVSHALSHVHTNAHVHEPTIAVAATAF